jgi:hypothetical protein
MVARLVIKNNGKTNELELRLSFPTNILLNEIKLTNALLRL